MFEEPLKKKIISNNDNDSENDDSKNENDSKNGSKKNDVSVTKKESGKNNSNESDSEPQIDID